MHGERTYGEAGEIPITPMMALKIGWLLSWRGLLLGLLIGFVTGFIVHAAGDFAGMSKEAINLTTLLLSSLLSLLSWYYVLKMAFAKQYRGFRLAIISTLKAA